MYSIQFELATFGDARATPDSLARIVSALAYTLYVADLEYLRLYPETPPLYESGVRYVAEAEGQEKWMDVPRVRELGRGDCEDLASWLAAELTLRGYPSRPRVTYQITPDNRILFHVDVLTPWGIEDPSRRLGMA